MMKRLFIGLPIESKIASKLALSWQNDWQLNKNRFNWTKPENWHVTLYFLGETNDTGIALLQNLIDQSFSETKAFKTRLVGVGTFPDTVKPKVLWIGLEDLSPLLHSREQLGGLLQQNGFSYDDKPLKPHLTIARIKYLVNRRVFEKILKEYGQFRFGTAEIGRIVLYESILTQQGPIYIPLFEKQLIR